MVLAGISEEEDSLLKPSPRLCSSGGSKGVEDTDECNVDKGGSILLTLDSKICTLSINVVNVVRFSSMNDTLEIDGSTGQISNAIRRFSMSVITG